MKKLILTVGLPRSGKTTWARQQNVPMVNRDSIRLALHGERYLPEAEGMISVLEENMVKSLFLAGHDTVIVDATHNTEKRRKRWVSDKWEIELKIIPFGKEICIQRAIAENDNEIIPIIEKMACELDIDSEEIA